MYLMRLANGTWIPDLLIEGWNSLTWTERYRDFGEFVMRSPLALDMPSKLPLDSLVAILQSREVMVVENYTIEDGENGPEWEATGRTIEAVWCGQRNTTTINSTPGAPGTSVISYAGSNQWPSSEAAVLLNAHIVSGIDSAVEKIDNLAGTTNLVVHPSGVTQMDYEHPAGDLYPEILRMLALEDAGIRSQRPLNATGGLGFWLYTGLDRSATQTVNAQVIFSTKAGHVIDPDYVFTTKDYRNVAYVYSPLWAERVYAPGVSTGVSGRSRRILYVDASNEIKSGTDAAKSRKAKQVGLAALAKVNTTKFFDGQISPQASSQYVYGTHYYLGDKVTLMADYGLSQTMQVTEYVRAQDEAEGERAYPTLIVPGATA